MKGMASAAEGGGDPLPMPPDGSVETLDEDQPYALSLLRSSCDSCWKKKVLIRACETGFQALVLPPLALCFDFHTFG